MQRSPNELHFPAALIAAAIAACLMVAWTPRALALAVGLSSAVMLAWWWRERRRHGQALLPDRSLLGLYAFALLALSSALWSADPRASVTKALYLLLVLAGAEAAVANFRTLGAAKRRRIGRALLASLAVTLLVIAVDTATNQLMGRWIYTTVPRLAKGLEEHIRFVDGVAAVISETNIKRRISAFTLLVAPALLLALTLLPRPRRTPAVAGLLSIAAVMIYAGPHQTSWIAGALGLAVFAVALRSRVAAARAVTTGFAAWVLLSLPIVWAAHGAGLWRADWLPNSARHRIVIWNTTANEVLKARVLGVGADATRRIFERREARHIERRSEGKYTVALTRHAHNAYVQIWYELGAAGALLLAASGLCVLRGISRLPSIAQPFAYAQFAATAVIMSSSYGIWQMWFQASIAVGATILIASAFIDEALLSPAASNPPLRTPTDSGAQEVGYAASRNYRDWQQSPSSNALP